IIASAAALLCVAAASASQQTINDGWRFYLGDDAAASATKFNDKSWREIRLPHDWAFEEGYSLTGAQKDKGGYASGGVGWYRKTLTLSERQLDDAENIFIDFTGVYMNSEVWVNGTYLGKRPYGYISFSYQIDKLLVKGDNTIAVRVDNTLEPSARWYHGCGIYGDVAIRTHDDIYFEKDGTFITTPGESIPTGEVCVSSEIMLADDQSERCTVIWELLDGRGKKIATIDKQEAILKSGINTLKASTKIANPKLWSPESPALYYVKMSILDDDKKLVDSRRERFGFRTVTWIPETGMHLNGVQTKMRGVCEHLEGGPTGAIWTEKLIRWKLQLIQDMGCNAVRVAHNPQLPLFYDICDEMGLLVMDEIFDGWMKKADFDYGMQAFDEWWERDLRAWVRRNRNHPSIFMYSVGNETHGEIAATLVKTCHEEDNTRLVTSGSCEVDKMDVIGMNGGSEKMSYINGYIPMDRAFVATENPHTWQVRGYYRTKTWYRNGYPSAKQEPEYIPDLTEKEIFGYDWTAPKNRRNIKQVFNSSYDNATVRVTARHLIQILREKPWFSGSFRWTGFDYLGEAGYVHGGWPFRAFQGGAMDLAGFEKDLFYLYQSEWTDKDMVHILPHWTHPRMAEGEKIPVWVYTSGDEAELLQDGKSLGKVKKGTAWDQMQCQWLVPWCEGELTAIAYRNGKEIAREVMRSSGAPATLKIESDNSALKSDCDDIAIVTLTQVDEAGTHYPYGENRIYTKIFGQAKMLSFESGSPVDVETNFMASDKCGFFGLNRMFIQSSAMGEKAPVSVMTGVISGDKQLTLSDKITIDVQETALRGKCPRRTIEIRYTTNGSEPTANSTLYTEPFAIKLGTEVKANVYSDGELLLVMRERFAEDEGLYWGAPGEEPCAFTGEQAEHAKLTDCKKTKLGGDGFYGDFYVLPTPNEGALEWYQENDGASMECFMVIRYSLGGEKNGQMELTHNGDLVKVVDFAPTGSQATHWQEVKVAVPINSGGNTLALKSVSNIAPSIDQIEIIE
ncbi:MAG: glycoside hydrolase family 2 TIM barrel-domain containing protein, partial [Rikenellaceae bacterium]